MKKGSVTFARSIVYIVLFAALAVCFLLLPELVREEAVGKPINIPLTIAFFALSYLIATPFFVAIFQTLKVLEYIEKKQAFSELTIKALQTIKNCTYIFNGLVVLAVSGGVTISKMIDPREDVTFMVTFGFIFVFVASVIAVFVAVLQKLLMDAVALKSENDLIV